MSDTDKDMFDWGSAGDPQEAKAKQRDWTEWREQRDKKLEEQAAKREEKYQTAVKDLQNNADASKDHIYIANISGNIANEIKRLIGEKLSRHDYVRLDGYVGRVANAERQGNRSKIQTLIPKLAAVRLTKKQAMLMKLSHGDKHHVAEDSNGKLWKEIAMVALTASSGKDLSFYDNGMSSIRTAMGNIIGEKL